ncbi:hypothetical protein KSP40_PGU012797 [Platanthera guangdongensis]|uniref:Uncharacterized protein n=1 Tax=Platanthera guangdongensis TaxID=2320717 RepID=A0ABR2M710_9ASPA
MPSTESQGSSTPFASIGRSILSIRRDQVHSMDSHRNSAADQELEAFQRHVACIFHGISGDANEILSLPWIRSLLDSFLICLEAFRVILFNSKAAALSRPPLDRLISEFFDRGVKALDICNAIRDGIDQIRSWRKHLEIVLVSLQGSSHHRPIGEGQLLRAKKAILDLSALMMLDEKEQRNRSFGHNPHNKDNHPRPNPSHFRSLSWSVSKTWSAAKQIQAMSSNLNAPRGSEISTSNGLAIPVFTMNNVLIFVMWTLVAAIPCQDRGLQTHFSIPRSFCWASPILSLHDCIVEELKKKDRKKSRGLLKEIHQIEKCVDHLTVLIHGIQFPLPEVKESEMKQEIQELARICNVLKDELDPLEHNVREVFNKIVHSRTECLLTAEKAHST